MLRAIRRKLEKSLRTRGLRGTLELSARNVVHVARNLSPAALWKGYRERDFDRRFGVDTSGRIDMSSLPDVEGNGLDHGYRYEATSTDEFDRVMATLAGLGVDLSEHTFIDIGCGKGRTLLLASLHSFRRIIGIEHSERLRRIAERNISLWRHPDQRTRDLSARLADATIAELPDGPCIFYLYNPFDGLLMEAFLENVKRSLIANPRPALVVYVNAIHAVVVDRTPFLVRLHGDQDLGYHTAIWRADPPL